MTRRRRGEGHHPIDAWAAALPQLSQAAAVFIFQIGSTLTTASSSSVVLINGAQACNVFWQVGSSAILGTGTTLAGNIIALTSITLTSGASSFGRVLARNRAVTLDTTTINATVCSSVVGGGLRGGFHRPLD